VTKICNLFLVLHLHRHLKHQAVGSPVAPFRSQTPHSLYNCRPWVSCSSRPICHH